VNSLRIQYFLNFDEIKLLVEPDLGSGELQGLIQVVQDGFHLDDLG
jgi:hypothetical protein